MSGPRPLTLREAAARHPNDRPLFYLLPERALSSTGRRTLLEREIERTNKRAQARPPLISFVDLARKVLRFFEQCEQQWTLPTAPLTEIEIVARLRACDPELGPRQAAAELPTIFTLEKLGLGVGDWREIIEGLESEKTDDQDLHEWTAKILRYLNCKALCASRNEVLSPYQYAELACGALDANEPAFWNWPRLLGVPAFEGTAVANSPSVALIVPENGELFPLEARLLGCLERAGAPVERVGLRPSSSSGSVGRELAARLPYVPLESSPDSSPPAELFWAHFEDCPGSATWTQQLVINETLDIAIRDDVASSPLQRALFLWAEYHEQLRPTFHGFNTDGRCRLGLVELGVDPDVAPTLRDVIEALLRHRSFLRPELIAVQNESGAVTAWIETLAELGYFNEQLGQTQTLEASPLDPKGKRIYQLRDLCLGFDSRIALLTNPKVLADLLDPSSLPWSGKRLLPRKVANLVERAGFSVPEPAREADVFARALATREDRVTIASFSPREPTARAMPILQSSRKKRHLSPSALELLYQCPYRYFGRYGLELDRRDETDPVRLSALSQGNWLHETLEAFFLAPDWDNPTPVLAARLELGLDEAFKKGTSVGYRAFVRRQIPNFAERLARHVVLFERVLRERAPIVKQLPELKVETTFFGRPFKGKIDRIDLLEGGRVLIWDYKTGSALADAPMKLLDSGKIQWLLYRALVEREGERLGLGAVTVAGGGFLNPLDPTRSRLYYFEESAPPALLAQPIAPYASRNVTARDRAALDERLAETYRLVLERFESDEYPPTPIDSRLCEHCDMLTACGRPYLAEATQ